MTGEGKTVGNVGRGYPPSLQDRNRGKPRQTMVWRPQERDESMVSDGNLDQL